MKTVNKKAVSAIIVALFSFSILAGVVPVRAGPAVFDVYEGELIQPVINSADAGDKIVVHEGTYSDEQLIVDKTLTILGDGAVLEYSQEPTIPYYFGSFGPFYFAIQITADDVRISGFEIYVTNEGYLSAVEASDCSGTEIINNIIEAPQWGASGMATANVKVKNSEITATTPVYYTNALDITVANNVLDSQPRGPGPLIGIYLPTTQYMPGSFSGAQVKNNEINSAEEGIHLENGFDAAISNNLVFSYTGIILGGSSNAVVSNNEVQANGQGIQVNGGSNVLIKNNEIHAGFSGISVDGPDMVIKNNFVDSVGTGIGSAISVHNGDNSVIKNNEVNTPGFAIAIGELSYETNNVLVSGNVIHNCYVGILPIYVSNSQIKNNVVISCGWFGIGLSGSNNVIKSNTVTGDFIHAINLRSWELDDGTIIETTNNLITKNVIVGGSTPDDIGIDLGPSTVDNTVSKNKISEVDFPIVDNGDNIIKS